MHVYHLKHEIALILSEIEAADGELTPEQLARIDALGTSTDEMVDNLFKIIRHAKVCEQALRGEITYMQKRVHQWSAVEDRCREHLKGLLEQLKVASYETKLCRPTICKGPPVVRMDEGFNLSSLKGTRYADLIEETINLRAAKVKELAKRNESLPEGIRVVSGEHYLRL